MRLVVVNIGVGCGVRRVWVADIDVKWVIRFGERKLSLRLNLD
jgi:hypothetical protein